MSVLLLTADLMCSSRVAGAAAAVGTAIEVAMTPGSLLAQAAGKRLVILDLDFRGIDLAGLLPQLRGLSPPPARVIAFGPHVHAASLAAARAAGCDEVLSRGQFYAQVAETLRASERLE